MRELDQVPGLRMTRRTLLLGAAATSCALASRSAFAQPVIPDVTIIAPGNVGGGFDNAARTLVECMQKEGLLGNAEVTNIPGAGGTIGLAQFVKQFTGRKDGLLTVGGSMLNTIITNKTPVSFADIRPIARLYTLPNIFVVPADSPYSSMADLMKDLKADVNSVSFAGGSIGGGEHLSLALAASAAGIDPLAMKYIAYAGGGEVTAAVLGGHVTAAVTGWTEVGEQVRAGQLKVIGITSSEPVPEVEAEPLRAQGIDTEFLGWSGVAAASGISDADYNVLLDAVTKTLHGAAWAEAVKMKAWLPLPLIGPEFEAYLAQQNEIMGKTLTALGLVK